MRINRYTASVLLASTSVSKAFVVPRPTSMYTSSASKHTNLNALSEEFQNDGPFFFMQPFLPLFGFTEGKTTYFGPGIDVQKSDYPIEEEQIARRLKAEKEMTNIGQDERDRRRLAGKIAYKVAIAYGIASSLFLDDGSSSGHLARFAIILPLFFASGFTKSADKGLCNVAQGGQWDVDGTGIRKIEDEDLARAFLEMVNKMNIETGRDAVIISGIFAALPHDLVARFAAIGVIFGGLYFLNGKIPKNA